MGFKNPLVKAARVGDVTFLKKRVNTEPADYFLVPAEEDDYYGWNFIHVAITNQQVKFLEQALTTLPSSTVRHLLCQQVPEQTRSLTGSNAFHIAVREDDDVSLVKLLVEFAKSSFPSTSASSSFTSKPWLANESLHGATPFQLALMLGKEDIALEMMSLDMELLCNMVDTDGNSPLFAAVRNGLEEVALKILTSGLRYNTGGHAGQCPLHVAPCCSGTTATKLVQKLPSLINKADDNGKTPLDVALASELDDAWFIELLLTNLPHEDVKSTWVEACKRGHVPTIEAFIKYCPDFRKKCIKEKDSPLHHIQLGSYNQYQDFLKIQLIKEMKNRGDFNNSTPLHRALERRDILLAEALLSTEGVSRNIQDSNGNTATNLLKELCDQQDGGDEWREMCHRIGIKPWLRTHYIQPDTMEAGAGITRAAASTGEMRGTLSVVAALLATLTFAAGFTLPGGLNQETGESLLAKKASFLVFILADTYAMCCAMLVFFFIMWSMVIADQDRSLILVGRSVLILKQSLYGTLLAFMTGVFTVISHKSLWASIVVIFMCCLVALVAVTANRDVLYKFLDTRERRNQTRILEEGTAIITSRGGDNS